MFQSVLLHYNIAPIEPTLTVDAIHLYESGKQELAPDALGPHPRRGGLKWTALRRLTLLSSASPLITHHATGRASDRVRLGSISGDVGQTPRVNQGRESPWVCRLRLIARGADLRTGKAYRG